MNITHTHLTTIYRQKLEEIRRRPYSRHGDNVEAAMRAVIDALTTLDHITLDDIEQDRTAFVVRLEQAPELI